MNIIYEGAVSSTSTTTEPELVSESESEPTSSTSSTSTTSMATTTETEIIEDVTGGFMFEIRCYFNDSDISTNN